MKKFDPFANLQLTPEEEQIEKDIENGLYVSVKNQKEEIARIVAIAKNTDKKSKSISFRIDPKNLSHFKANAAREGLPYQTLLYSLVHKYNTGQLIFKDTSKERYLTSQELQEDKN